MNRGSHAPVVPERVELWPVEQLIPNARNARTHSDAQIAELAGSIAAFGFMVPVLVDAEGLIIAGHARVMAARELNLERVPVILVTHLSEAEKRAYAIADNQIALHAGWNEELLRVELEALQADGIELPTVGFSQKELDELVDRVDAEFEGDNEDSVPDLTAETICKPGELWQLGNHRLLCADATDAASYDALLTGDTADLVFCDPPYNVSYRSASGESIVNDSLGANFGAFLETACSHLLRNCKGALYICMSSSELHTLQSAFVKAGGHWSTFIIWGKNTFTLGRSDYQRQYEPILYGWREGGPHYWCGARDQGDLWLVDKPAVNDLHPTMKPVALVERAIRNSSRRGDLVLDPFAGSGSTLIACEKTGRCARVMEIEPKYCDVIIRRWQEMTGDQAVLLATGQSFADLQVERSTPTPERGNA